MGTAPWETLSHSLGPFMHGMSALQEKTLVGDRQNGTFGRITGCLCWTLPQQPLSPPHTVTSPETQPRDGLHPGLDPPLPSIPAVLPTPNNAPRLPHTVVKMRIKEMTEENGERRLVAAQKKKVLKLGPLKRKDTKKMVLHMRNAGACPCPQLDSLSGSFLVMGRKVGGRLLLLAIYPWQKHNKEMKFAVKFMFSYPCPLYHPLLYGAGQH